MELAQVLTDIKIMENGIALIRGEFLFIVASTALGLMAIMWNLAKHSKSADDIGSELVTR